MAVSIWRTTSFICFRACVALRRILAVRKPKPVARPRKAAAILGLFCALAGGANGSDEFSAQAPAGNVERQAIEINNDWIRPIHQLGTSIANPPGELPTDVAQCRFEMAPRMHSSLWPGRDWPDFTYVWQAPGLCHRPLYFEEPNLERYGHSAGHVVQPLVSAAHFAAAVPALPVNMALRRPWNCAYTLGHARPGSSAPWARY
jgi:hypothetical protein